jgi:hypothetical protein
VSSASAINRAIEAFGESWEAFNSWVRGAAAVAGSPAPILSALNFNNFNGLSVIEGGLKTRALINAEGLPDDLHSYRFGLGGIEEAPVPEGAAARLTAALGGAKIDDVRLDDIDPALRERLKALGYTN